MPTKSEKPEQTSIADVIDENDNIETNSAQDCAICLDAFHEQEIGLLDACEHKFCSICILKWSDNRHTCPIDRKSFTKIKIWSQFADGVLVRTVNIKRPLLAEDPEINISTSDPEDSVDIESADDISENNTDSENNTESLVSSDSDSQDSPESTFDVDSSSEDSTDSDDNSDGNVDEDSSDAESNVDSNDDTRNSTDSDGQNSESDDAISVSSSENGDSSSCRSSFSISESD